MTSEDFMVNEEFIQDPHAVVARLREGGPVHRVRLQRGLPCWIVTGYDDVRALLADPRLAKDNGRMQELATAKMGEDASRMFGEALTQHMLNSDPPDHTRLRKLVNKAFTGRTVARLRPRIEEITTGLLDALDGREQPDLVRGFARPLPITVICELLGIATERQADFCRWSDTLLSTAETEDVIAAAEQMHAYLVELIARKRAEPAEDLLSDLVHATDEGDRLTEFELVSMTFLLLVAGYETTVNLIANGVLALLRAPDQLALVRSDPALLPDAIEEFLRYDGPISLASLRFTKGPVEVGGVTIPEGEFMLLSLLGANRDAERFEDPARLDVTRPAGGHVAFGHGIHYCVGAPLARLEAEIAIGRLLERFPGLRLAAEPETLRWRESNLVHGLESLPVALS
ncbi:cytochrome P450 [Amycolatopsis sp. NPDC059021]|uniref:cytochrome P450 family protein n=1 Tax=Amycolatopsis sp. NPDC059021 TaxID=3346704 RepID=UPI00366EFC78